MLTIRDLCSTCFYSPGCINEGGEEKPVLYCEEFYQPPSPPSPPANNPSKPGRNRPQAVNYAEGLCCNCENRQQCGTRMVEGGVWHCEEYR